MSAHVLLNLLNELGEKMMRGFAEHLIGFPPPSLINSIIQVKRMQDSIYHDTKIAFY